MVRRSKLNIQYTQYISIAITAIVVIVVIAALVFIWYTFKTKQVVPAPEGLIKLQIKPELYSDIPGRDVVFERADIEYYEEQPRMLLDYIDFDLPRHQVDIPDADNQNVHDSFVQKSIRKIFSEVSDTWGDIDTCIREILQETGGDPEIKKVLDKIKNRNSNIVNLGDKNESQILVNTWEKAKNNDNIKRFLITQLRDSIENNSVVCPTGIVTRLGAALQVETPENFPKTRDNIVEEMMYTAAKLQNTLEKDPHYTNLSDNEQTDKFKSDLMNKYSNDYSGILTTDEINEIVAPWINHV